MIDMDSLKEQLYFRIYERDRTKFDERYITDRVWNQHHKITCLDRIIMKSCRVHYWQTIWYLATAFAK